ncbi:diguanylate cyclase [Krasilnikovia sp. MM14-A1004]|uniref:GGDEF domain-containing protein n=1 Tax=Krasilnikovia sp. MM14-A1004 TaxID=3373541 RepID=UPI00399C96B2
MNGIAIGAAELSAALQALEDQDVDHPEAAFATVAELEQQAVALGDELLAVRARFLKATMLVRAGDPSADAQRTIYRIHQWALAHGDRRLQARTHLQCAYAGRVAGDMANFLEHALSAVELLDENASPYMQVWHRAKLADALADNGDPGAARLRFSQAEELARELDQRQLLTRVLNNWAYSEYEAGEFPRAREVVGRLLAYAEEHGIELDPADLDTVAAIQTEYGEYGEAEQTMLLAIARHEAGAHNGAEALAHYLLTLACAQRRLGELDRARASLDASRELCAEGKLTQVMLRVHQEQAELHAAGGDFAAAFAAQAQFMAAQESVRSEEADAKAQTRWVQFETAEAREEAERFREQGRRDPLTGLRNRRYTDEELPSLIAADPDLVLAIADIDHFKRINDQLSHDTGDQVLIQVAKLLETELAAVAPDGFVARLGGEEFLLVLSATAATVAAGQLDSIRQAVSAHGWRAITGELPVTVSIGVARVSETVPADQTTALATADRNLYTAKREGRNRVVATSEPDPLPRIDNDQPAA